MVGREQGKHSGLAAAAGWEEESLQNRIPHQTEIPRGGGVGGRTRTGLLKRG